MKHVLPDTTFRRFYHTGATSPAEVVLLYSSQLDAPSCDMSQKSQLTSKHTVLQHDPKSAS